MLPVAVTVVSVRARIVRGIVHVVSGVSTIAEVTLPREVPVASIRSGLPSCETLTLRIVGE